MIPQAELLFNNTDPTGHWFESIHHEMAEKALKKSGINLKKAKLKILKKGSYLPDISGKHEQKVWHGHAIRKKQVAFWRKHISDFRKRLNKRSKKSLILLGTVLHSLQDFYAHSYPMGSKGDLLADKNPSAATKFFHRDYTEGKKRSEWGGKANMAYHGNKDNPQKDFVNGKWVSGTKRYNLAIDSSVDLINLCFKKSNGTFYLSLK